MTIVRSTAPTTAFQAPSPAMAGAASGGGTAVVGALVTSWAGVLTVAAVVAWLGVVGLRVLLGAGNLAGGARRGPG